MGGIDTSDILVQNGSGFWSLDGCKISEAGRNEPRTRAVVRKLPRALAGPRINPVKTFQKIPGAFQKLLGTDETFQNVLSAVGTTQSGNAHPLMISRTWFCKRRVFIFFGARPDRHEFERNLL